MAARNDREPRFSVYQLGLGRDPVIVVGNILFAVGPSIISSTPRLWSVNISYNIAEPTDPTTSKSEWANGAADELGAPPLIRRGAI
jgi:hypothetical protein